MIALGRGLRAIAVLIAVKGVVDPAFTWSRSDRPLVALLDAGAPDLSAELGRELARDFDVHAGAVAGAAATVLAGDVLPDPIAVSGALVAVTPAPRRPRVEIERVSAPDTAEPGSRVPIDVAVRAVGATGRTLRVDVVSGAILLDRATHAVAGDDERFNVRLSAPALAAAGLARFDVRVSDDARDDAALTAERAVATEMARARWKVLVVDARPSWASAFVRRALEADRRFDVSSRVTTSRAIAVEAGAAPSLSDAASLESYAAIVVGAPDALSAGDVRALELFARNRGGAVVLLLDRVDAGAAARIAGAASLRDVHGVERRKVAGDAGTMIATELAVPVSLGPGVDVLATTAAQAAVWQNPLGAGRVIVSGALDAWRYRAREQNGFARFWTAVVGAAAASAPAPVTLRPSARLVAPGADVDVRVIVRRAQLSDPSRPAPMIDVRARLIVPVADMAPVSLRLWPTAERGVFVAPVHLPSRGNYEVAIDAIDETGASIGTASAFVTAGDVPRAPEGDTLASWTTSRGGVVVAGARTADVRAALSTRVSMTTPPARVHPMRSLWWLPIFVAALGGEWWLRRRRGER